jgi:hypothetical protein
MTYALFGRVAVLGDGWAAEPPGPAQPAFDPAGRPVPEADDGPETTPLMLQGMSAGILQSPQDAGRVTFDGVGWEGSATLTAGRLLLSARSTPHGRWVGQVRYRWISDIAVRPRAGRRDNGGVRVLFLDPLSPTGFEGRHYVDLFTARKIPPGAFAWDLLQHIVVDRHRWIPAGAVTDHLMVQELLERGPKPLNVSAWYGIPVPSVPPVSVPPVSVPPVSVPPGFESPGFESHVSAADRPAPVVPDMARPADQAAPPRPVAPTPGPDTAMIVVVPGVGRHSAETLSAPAPSTPAPATATPVPVRSLTAQRPTGVGSHRVDLDTGEAVVIDSATLFGRDPAADDGEDVALHAVRDATLSFSKTHLLLTPSAAGISVTDRYSTNGVLVAGNGPPRPCVPGVPALLDLPATLQIGTRTMTVSATR